jgi:hypothetical protein
VTGPQLKRKVAPTPATAKTFGRDLRTNDAFAPILFYCQPHFCTNHFLIPVTFWYHLFLVPLVVADHRHQDVAPLSQGNLKHTRLTQETLYFLMVHDHPDTHVPTIRTQFL